MKKLILGVLLLLVLACLTGCSEGFPDEEMHFGIQDNVRPYAVVIEPAEAAPGETVTVTLLARAPDPDAVDVTWRVALDYNIGLYEADEVERNYRELAPELPESDSDGFLTQTFQWVVPDSALLYSSALPEVLTDPAMIYLAGELIGNEAGSPPTKTAVDAWLKALTPEMVAAMPPLEREAAWALADRFASQVRFRLTLRTGQIVDVTRNLTIRHTDRLDGPNTNHNALVTDFGVFAVEKVDATRNDLEDPGIPKTWYGFVDGQGARVADQVEIPIHAGWTYYLTVGFSREIYSSPFDPTGALEEQGTYRWYYYRQDAPRSDHHFFVTTDGDDAEMWNLSDQPRIMPDGAGSTFRVLAAVRDTREEWAMYQAAPGTGVAEGLVVFVDP